MRRLHRDWLRARLDKRVHLADGLRPCPNALSAGGKLVRVAAGTPILNQLWSLPPADQQQLLSFRYWDGGLS